ncbi:MAG: hypothetical protein S4CHLAM20_08480 [Chlamydiia bacterium]|nr:hypothetical protein [Chlamydiia bacterium]
MIETKSKVLQNALEFCENHKSKYTGCIHFKNDREDTRDVIPIFENILYGMSLVSTLSKEKAEKGLAFIERLFHFSTENGFCGYVHDFPQVYQDKPNVWILLSLSYFLKHFSKVIPSSSRVKIESKRDELISIIQKRELKFIDQYVFETAMFKKPLDFEPTSLSDYETLILCKLLREEDVTLPWHRELDVYTGSLPETYYEKHLPKSSLFSQLAIEQGVHISALYTALLPKNTYQDLISYPSFERDDLFVNHQEDLLSIHFDKHSIVAQGSFDLKVDGDHIDIFLDEFEEISFYFSDYLNSKVLIEDQKATAFYPQDKLTLQTEKKTLTLSFNCKKHSFMGHIMKGNRENQLIDCNQNFALFDHKIHLRTTIK